MKTMIKVVYETLEKDNRDWVPKAHYPSSAGFVYADGTVVGPDTLSQFLKWTGHKPSNPADAKSLLRMRLGDGAHEALAKIFAKSGFKVLSEVGGKVVVPGLHHPVSYRVDHLIEIDGELEVVEVKSTQGFALKMISQEGPKSDHLLQVICYLNVVPGSKRARLLYIDRESGDMREFVVERYEDSYTVNGEPVKELSWRGIVDRWIKLEEVVKLGVTPAPDYKAWINESTGEVMPVKTIKGEKFKTDWRVLYDPFKDFIWKNPANFKYSYNAIHKA